MVKKTKMVQKCEIPKQQFLVPRDSVTSVTVCYRVDASRFYVFHVFDGNNDTMYTMKCCSKGI